MTHDKAAVMGARLDAAPEVVWRAFVEAEALAEWYWPASVEPVVRSEPRVGGRFGIEAKGMGFSGEYVEFDVPRRMVQAWRWAGDDRDSRVTVELAAAGGGTDLVVTHDLVDAATSEMYRAGWESCLARLPGYLAGVKAAG